MKLSIISVNVSTKTSAKGKPYQVAEVIYKNDTGKVENKNITEYSTVFKSVCDAKPGQVFNVKSEKDANGYWQWTSFEQSVGETAPVSANTGVAASSKGTWETAEERAARQVLIVKQSCLSNAVNTLSVGAKQAPNIEQVLSLAQTYTDWVFGNKQRENHAS